MGQLIVTEIVTVKTMINTLERSAIVKYALEFLDALVKRIQKPLFD